MNPTMKGTMKGTMNPDDDGTISHEIPPAPQLALIPVNAIAPSHLNPRRRFDATGLAELAVSIQQHGVLEPIIVRRQAGVNTPFSLLAGERRWRAAMLAGLAEVPCVIRVATDDAAALALMLVENLQREDLDPIAQAEAFSRLADLGWTQSAIGEKVGKSQPVIANAIRLLGLPIDVRELIGDGKISPAHGRALARWNTDPERCRSLARQAMDHDLTSRDLEKMRDDLEELRERHAITGKAQQEAERAELEEAEQDAQRALADLTGHSPEPEPRTCRVCGCTNEEGCEQGCWWVDTDLCSACLAASVSQQRSVYDVPEPTSTSHPDDDKYQSDWHHHLDALRDLALDYVRNHANFDRFHILDCWTSLRRLRHDAVRHAANALGLIDPETIFAPLTVRPAPTPEVADYLAALGPILRSELVALSLVLSELEPWDLRPGSPTPLTDWLLGEEPDDA